MRFNQVVILISVLCIGCATYFGGRAEWVVSPPDWYRTLYEQVEECRGMEGNFDEVTWVIKRDPWENEKGKIGEFKVKGDTITLLLGWENEQWLVRHESLHHIDSLAWHPRFDIKFWECNAQR